MAPTCQGDLTFGCNSSRPAGDDLSNRYLESVGDKSRVNPSADFGDSAAHTSCDPPLGGMFFVYDVRHRVVVPIQDVHITE